MKLFALIVAGGVGSRMKSDIPKQFMLLNKRPVLMHTMQQFFAFHSKIELVIVLPENQLKTWQDLCVEHYITLKHKLVCGGESRFASVFNGLNEIEEEGIVFIHDGVRPLVSIDTIQRCYDATLLKGNAIPVMPVIESLRRIGHEKNEAVNRAAFVSIQTPQVFMVNEIKEAYNMGFEPSFTDDAGVLERLGKKINLVEGNLENIKITTPYDIEIATTILNKPK